MRILICCILFFSNIARCVISTSLFQTPGGSYCLVGGEQHYGDEEVSKMNTLHTNRILHILRSEKLTKILYFFVELPKFAVDEFQATGELSGELPDYYLTILRFWSERLPVDEHDRLRFVSADKRPIESTYLWAQMNQIATDLAYFQQKKVANFQKTEKFKNLRRMFIGMPEKNDLMDSRWLTIERYFQYLASGFSMIKKWYERADTSLQPILANKLQQYETNMKIAQDALKGHDRLVPLAQFFLNKIEKSTSLTEAITLQNTFEYLFGSAVDFIYGDAGFLKQIYKISDRADSLILTGESHARVLRKDFKKLGWYEFMYKNASTKKDYVDFVDVIGDALLRIVCASSKTVGPTKLSSSEQSNKVKEAKDPICFHCGTGKTELGSQLKYCARCGQASYCSKDCQIKDWKKHKEHCKKKVLNT